MYTQEEIQQIEDDYREEQKQQYAKRQAEKYERLEKHSLDEDNQRKYQKRKSEWQEVVAQMDDSEKILSTTYKAKDLDELSLDELRKIAEKKATEYYKSGKAGISFGETSLEDVAKRVATSGSRTSLKKDILSMQKKMEKPVVKTGDSDIIEMHRKGSTHRKLSTEGKKVIDKATYHKITKPAIEAGADIRIADNETNGVILSRLIEQNATAVTYGDVIYFRKDATVSDVLEEVHHFYQNKRGMNSQYSIRQRIIMNEIDAKKYLLSVTEKYKIPLEEVELTQKQLESYQEEMQELRKKGVWDE